MRFANVTGNKIKIHKKKLEMEAVKNIPLKINNIFIKYLEINSTRLGLYEEKTTFFKNIERDLNNQKIIIYSGIGKFVIKMLHLPK